MFDAPVLEEPVDPPVGEGDTVDGAADTDVDTDGAGATRLEEDLLAAGAADVEETGGRETEAEGAWMTLDSGPDDERAATILEAGAVVTGTGEGTAGRADGPIPKATARKAAIQPSKASNSCFS